jgi:glycosyltransferase involved in cell wall biosynthesis
MNVSAIVCAKNESKVIAGCLRALLAQQLRPEIVVVDGHSTDGTVNIAKKFADIIVYDNGRGLGDARNVGAAAANGKIIAYCDADARPLPDWTAMIVKLLRGKACVSGPLLPYDGSTKLRVSIKLWADLLPRALARLGYHCVWGANMAFRRRVLERYPFREVFLEDYDIGRRLRRSGSVRFCSELKMPISTRRFEQSFYRTCLRYYVWSFFKFKLGLTERIGYF